MQTPLVCIIILNWNGYEITKDCLLSLQSIKYPNYKIIIIDNGSEDKSVEKLDKEFAATINIISLEKNIGFTGGNNAGFAFARQKYDPDYFLMLNNDTIVTENFLSEMVVGIKKDSKSYAAVPKILYYDAPDLIWFAGGTVSRLTGIVKHYGLNKKDLNQFDIPGDTNFMNGCCALISKETINEIGILDDRFFANSEDADYSLRILDSEHTIQYIPTAVIYHRVNHSFKSNKGQWLAFYLAARNIIQLQKKHLVWWKIPIFILLYSVRWIGYLTLKLTFSGDIKSVKGIYCGLWDGALNKLRFVNNER